MLCRVTGPKPSPQWVSPHFSGQIKIFSWAHLEYNHSRADRADRAHNSLNLITRFQLSINNPNTKVVILSALCALIE
jgi:hypothetical protein